MKKSKNQLKEQALEEIKELFNQAKEQPAKADDYIIMIRRIAMKLNLRLPKELKRKYCKNCYKYFKAGNYKARTRKGYMVYHCFNCKKMMKFKINTINS